MRIWSTHPKYLDTKGLVALWRETLLAKKVLEGSTIGYKNHPQLIRFKNQDYPLDAINQYLAAVYQESLVRGYNFDKEKFNVIQKPFNMVVNNKQIEFEMQHLLNKLIKRDMKRYRDLLNVKTIMPHPLFKIIAGEIEEWEII